MASPPDAGGSRYVGRIVDPDVREDGETEPEVELNPSPPLSAAPAGEPEPEPAQGAVEPPLPPSAGAGALGRGAQVRERLLAKARAAERSKVEEPSALDRELEDIARDPAVQLDEDAEFVPPPAAGRAPAAPLAPASPRELSPSLVALFTTLVGIATIASVTALFMSLETRWPARSAGALAAAPAPSTATLIGPSREPTPKPKRQRHKIPGPWRISDAKGDPKYRFIEGQVGLDPFLKSLEAAGAPQSQGYRVLVAMRGILDLDNCNKSDRFEALLERSSGRLYALEYIVSPEEIYQAKEVDGRLTGSKLDLKIEHGQVTGAMSYDGSSFDQSADVAGFDPGLDKVVQRALEGHMALEELERGDVLKLVVQEVTVLGEFSRYAGVEALELIPVDPKKTHLRIYYSDAPGLRGYYDHNGRAPDEGGWHKPIKDAPRTSPFNPHRMNPVLHKIMPHQGTDFGAPVGTPIGAASYGTVSFMGPAGAAGNLVKVMHPSGIETGYAHMSRFADGLKVGDKVSALQVLGYVGSTGRSTGPHLHFSASRDGVFFDPETLNLDGMRVLSDKEREAFKPVMVKYDAMLDHIAMPERYAPLPPPPPPPQAVAAAAPADTAAPDDESESDAPAPPAAAAAPAPAAPAPAAAPGGAPAPKPGTAAVYLTDKELLQAQSASDDGEVDE